jgi:hypothetical protein
MGRDDTRLNVTETIAASVADRAMYRAMQTMQVQESFHATALDAVLTSAQRQLSLG